MSAGFTIRVNCKNCKLMDISPDDMLVFVRGNDGEYSTYSFKCPECGEAQRIRKKVPNHIINMLAEAKVHVISPLTEELIRKEEQQLSDEIEEFLKNND